MAQGGAEARRLYKAQTGLKVCGRAAEAAQGADALVVMTEWNEFRSPDFPGLKKLLTAPVIFDGRNLYEPATVRAAGLEYFGIGRGT